MQKKGQKHHKFSNLAAPLRVSEASLRHTHSDQGKFSKHLLVIPIFFLKPATGRPAYGRIDAARSTAKHGKKESFLKEEQKYF